MSDRSAPGNPVQASTRQGAPHLDQLLDILAEELVGQFLAEVDAEGAGDGGQIATVIIEKES